MRTTIIIFGFLVCFSMGYFSHKPKTITKEVKVYDFTQEPKVFEAYLNTEGKTIKDLSEYNRQKEAIITEIKNLGIDKLKAEIEEKKLEMELKKLEKVTK